MELITRIQPILQITPFVFSVFTLIIVKRFSTPNVFDVVPNSFQLPLLCRTRTPFHTLVFSTEFNLTHFKLFLLH